MSGEDLVEMRNEPYNSEDVLQELLAKHPDLLAGRQVNADVPRRCLLARREIGSRGSPGNAERRPALWSSSYQVIFQHTTPVTELRHLGTSYATLSAASPGPAVAPPDDMRSPPS